VRIAVDAKWYHRGPAGAHTHVRNLIDTLHEIDTENTYDIHLRSGDPLPPHLTGPRWRAHRLWPNLSAPRVWWALPAACRKRHVDLFFTQSLAPLTRRAPRVVTVHDVLWHDFPEHFTLAERLHFRLIDGALRRAEVILTDSEYSKERICAVSGRSPSDVVAIPLGVSPRFRPVEDPSEREALRARLRLPERFILYVGRINRRKNLPTLLSALSRLPEAVPLVCAGARDWKQDDLDRSLSSLGLKERVMFLGRVADEDLPGLYSLASVFAYIPFAEGFGIPPLEAMACGTPVVVSNAASLPEVVGEAGVLVPPGDAESVAAALSDLLGDAARRGALSRRGIARAGLFTWRRTAEKVMELWRRFA
jgi:glycosyltransferase involved in cell wall biosynthesis